MTVLAFCPRHNTSGLHDATGAFQPEAQKFALLHGGDVVIVDNHTTKTKMREIVLAEIRLRKPTTIAFFCHGWKSGVQFGFGFQHVDSLAACIAQSCPYDSPIVPLYACSTGDGPGVGGDLGFADALRDALCRAGATWCQVFAHTTAGHATENPYVRRFSGSGSPSGGIGGSWIVTPKSDRWSRWVKSLKGDLRLRYPLMSDAEIHEELSK
jgi:hypothetical protein